MANITETNLPNLIVIGAMKSGTTSLHYYLNLHPEICMSRQKELNFFIGNWDRGIEWYKSHFVGQAKIHGETTPNYTNYPKSKDAPQRMFSLIPETKLIYIIKEPIARIVSHYVHRYADNKENRNIEEALAEFEGNRYIERSRYFFQLKQYLLLFSASNILVITSEQLSNFPEQTMRKVFQFLEVDSSFKFKFEPKKNAREFLRFGNQVVNSEFKFDKKLHDSSQKRRLKIASDSSTAKALATMTSFMPSEIAYHFKKIIYLPFSDKIKRPTISDSLRQKLLDYLAEDINSLKEFTGYSFNEWNLE